MPFFDYRAIDQTGRTTRGTLAAVNDVDLELRLKRMGLDLITLVELSRQEAPRGRGGGQTGLLDSVFDRLAESLKWQEEVAAKAKRLMIYPALVLTVVGAAILFLLVYLVPQVLSLVETMW